MRAKPIQFSTPMVRANREGAKTQTRRILKPQPDPRCTEAFRGEDGIWRFSRPTARFPVSQSDDDRNIRFVVGDILWVREAWRTDVSFDHLSPKQIEERCIIAGYKRGWAPIAYDAGGYSPSWGTNDWHELGRKRASMHLPRWASRLTLEVTGVKVERLQDISEADAKAEGCDKAFLVTNMREAMAELASRVAGAPSTGTYRIGYAKLWDEINGANSWDENPWVVAVIFKVHRMNVDAFLERAAA
ncbi:MAG: hypothetical protein ACK4TP_10100 [Hyphomicrobium sp.]